jgi:hypothetical protein
LDEVRLSSACFDPAKVERIILKAARRLIFSTAIAQARERGLRDELQARRMATSDGSAQAECSSAGPEQTARRRRAGRKLASFSISVDLTVGGRTTRIIHPQIWQAFSASKSRKAPNGRKSRSLR